MKTFMIQDKMLGHKYTVIAQTKTHYIAIDFMNEQVRVHKSQAVRVGRDEMNAVNRKLGIK